MSKCQRDEIHDAVLRIISNKYDEHDLELTVQFINEELLLVREVTENDFAGLLDACKATQRIYLHKEILGLVNQAWEANDNSPPDFNYEYCKEILGEADTLLTPISYLEEVPKVWMRLVFAIHEFTLFCEDISEDFLECQAIAEQILFRVLTKW